MDSVALFDRSEWVRAAFATLIRSRRFRIWAGILALLGIILAFLPLFWVLGFEFSFAISIVGSVAAMDLGAALVRQLRIAKVQPSARAIYAGQLIRSLWFRAFITSLATIVVPVVLICLNAIRVRNCDFSFGFKALVILPVVSMALASGIGVIIGLATSSRPKLGLALPYLALIVSALWSVWRFYAAPPVFSYNIFAGYFPGNIYDEAIFLGGPLIWSRFYQLALVGSALAAASLFVDVPRAAIEWRGTRRPEGPRFAVIITALVCALVCGTLKFKSGTLGFSIDADDIREALDSSIETENFTIHYRAGGSIGENIELIADDHEFRLAQLVRTLGVKPKKKITSFYFSSAAEKAALMGARNVHMAKPWRGEFYLNHAPFPHQVLRHEIAHVVAGEFGDPIFSVSASTFLGLPLRFNVGLIEGLAVAADWPDHFNRALTPHQSVKALTELKMAPRLESLLSTGFLAVSSARSYTTSGSFVRFLLETRGPDRVRALYRSGGDFEESFGEPLSKLATEWREMIAATPLPPGAAEIVRERFRRRSIFARKCPHAIARSRARVGQLAGRGKLGDAIEKMRSVCDDVPGEPRYLMELAALLSRNRQYEEADGIYLGIASDNEKVSSELRARSILRRAEIAAVTERWSDALSLIEQAAALPVGDSTKRLAVVQKMAIDDARDNNSNGIGGDTPFKRYFWGVRPGLGGDAVASVARAALAISQSPDSDLSGLGHYLIGFNLRHRRAAKEATTLFLRALELGLPHPLVRREAARLLAEAAYISGNHDAVLRAASILAEPNQPEVLRLSAADWVERVRWKKTGKLSPTALSPADVPNFRDSPDSPDSPKAPEDSEASGKVSPPGAGESDSNGEDDSPVDDPDTN